MLVTTLIDPSIELIKAQPTVLALKEWFKARLASSSGEDGKPNDNADDDQADDDDIREETLAMRNGVQGGLVKVYHALLMCCVFGPMVPGLLCLIPFTVVATLCASSWLQSEPTKHKSRFGQLLAANVMVQSPGSIIAQLGVPLSWLICGFTMWDLEFSNGAMIFYSFLSVCTLCAHAVRRFKLGHSLFATDCTRVEDRDKQTPITRTQVLWFRDKNQQPPTVIAFEASGLH